VRRAIEVAVVAVCAEGASAGREWDGKVGGETRGSAKRVRGQRDNQDAKSLVAYRVVVELQYIWCAMPYSLLRRLEGTDCRRGSRVLRRHT
jgi:hypothetical protein